MRPDNARKAKARERNQERYATDPNYAETKRQAVREWYARNPEHARQLKRNSRIRLAAWNEAIKDTNEFVVVDPDGAEIEIFHG
jgi:ferric-dicitrate binding protein FerR (iron transport regulator)